MLILELAEVKLPFKKVNPRKASEPDDIPGHSLKLCADQQAEAFTNIYNFSLKSVISTSFNESIVILVPKKAGVSCLNIYRTVTLPSVILKSLEWHGNQYVCNN